MVDIANKKTQSKTTKNQSTNAKKSKTKKIKGTNGADVRKQAAKILKNQEKEKQKNLMI